MSQPPNVATALERLRELDELARGSELRGAASVWCSGWPELDAVLSGGVPRGRVTEWAGSRSSGKTAALRELVRSVRLAGAGAAYVDAARTLAPAPWATLEAELAQEVGSGGGMRGRGDAGERGSGGTIGGTRIPLFWVVRPPEVRGALLAAEELLRSGAFGLVIVEGADWSRTPVVRLQRLAREVDAALVAVADRPGRVPLAARRVEFDGLADGSGRAAQGASNISSVRVFRRRVRSQGHGFRELCYAQTIPYRLPEDSGFPDRRASSR